MEPGRRCDYASEGAGVFTEVPTLQWDTGYPRLGLGQPANDVVDGLSNGFGNSIEQPLNLGKVPDLRVLVANDAHLRGADAAPPAWRRRQRDVKAKLVDRRLQ